MARRNKRTEETTILCFRIVADDIKHTRWSIAKEYILYGSDNGPTLDVVQLVAKIKPSKFQDNGRIGRKCNALKAEHDKTNDRFIAESRLEPQREIIAEILNDGGSISFGPRRLLD